jgi:hypothetical protein
MQDDAMAKAQLFYFRFYTCPPVGPFAANITRRDNVARFTITS